MVIDLKTALITARVITAQHWFKSMWISDINLFSPISSTKLTLLWRGPYVGASCKMDEDPSKFIPTFLRKMSWEVLPLPNEKASNEVAQ